MVLKAAHTFSSFSTHAQASSSSGSPSGSGSVATSFAARKLRPTLSSSSLQLQTTTPPHPMRLSLNLSLTPTPTQSGKSRTQPLKLTSYTTKANSLMKGKEKEKEKIDDQKEAQTSNAKDEIDDGSPVTPTQASSSSSSKGASAKFTASKSTHRQHISELLKQWGTKIKPKTQAAFVTPPAQKSKWNPGGIDAIVIAAAAAADKTPSSTTTPQPIQPRSGRAKHIERDGDVTDNGEDNGVDKDTIPDSTGINRKQSFNGKAQADSTTPTTVPPTHLHPVFPAPVDMPSSPAYDAYEFNLDSDDVNDLPSSPTQRLREMVPAYMTPSPVRPSRYNQQISTWTPDWARDLNDQDHQEHQACESPRQEEYPIGDVFGDPIIETPTKAKRPAATRDPRSAWSWPRSQPQIDSSPTAAGPATPASPAVVAIPKVIPEVTTPTPSHTRSAVTPEKHEATAKETITTKSQTRATAVKAQHPVAFVAQVPSVGAASTNSGGVGANTSWAPRCNLTQYHDYQPQGQRPQGQSQSHTPVFRPPVFAATITSATPEKMNTEMMNAEDNNSYYSGQNVFINGKVESPNSNSNGIVREYSMMGVESESIATPIHNFVSVTSGWQLLLQQREQREQIASGTEANAGMWTAAGPRAMSSGGDASDESHQWMINNNNSLTYATTTNNPPTHNSFPLNTTHIHNHPQQQMFTNGTAFGGATGSIPQQQLFDSMTNHLPQQPISQNPGFSSISQGFQSTFPPHSSAPSSFSSFSQPMSTFQPTLPQNQQPPSSASASFDFGHQGSQFAQPGFQQQQQQYDHANVSTGPAPLKPQPSRQSLFANFSQSRRGQSPLPVLVPVHHEPPIPQSGWFEELAKAKALEREREMQIKGLPFPFVTSGSITLHPSSSPSTGSRPMKPLPSAASIRAKREKDRRRERPIPGSEEDMIRRIAIEKRIEKMLAKQAEREKERLSKKRKANASGVSSSGSGGAVASSGSESSSSYGLKSAGSKTKSDRRMMKKRRITKEKKSGRKTKTGLSASTRTVAAAAAASGKRGERTTAGSKAETALPSPISSDSSMLEVATASSSTMATVHIYENENEILYVPGAWDESKWGDNDDEPAMRSHRGSGRARGGRRDRICSGFTSFFSAVGRML